MLNFALCDWLRAGKSTWINKKNATISRLDYLSTDRAKVQEAGAETSGRRIELTGDGNSSVTQSEEQKDFFYGNTKGQNKEQNVFRGVYSQGYFGFQVE